MRLEVLGGCGTGGLWSVPTNPGYRAPLVLEGLEEVTD